MTPDCCFDGHAQRGLAGSEAFGGHGHAAGTARQPVHEARRRASASSNRPRSASVMAMASVEHGSEHGVERKLRMQQHGRFQQQIQLAEADGRSFAGGNTSHARQEIFDGDFRRGGMEDELVGIFQAEGDDVTFLQDALGDFLAVDKQPELISAILQNILFAFRENHRAIAGDAAVRDGQLISHFAAANCKGQLGDRYRPARVLR